MSDDESGTYTSGTDRSECTIMDCSGEAEYAYWMPDLGQFSRAKDPEHDLLDDGDLAPYVCESCRDRMGASPHWEDERFVNPREKLIADGGTERQRGYGWICTGCKKVVSSRPFGPCHDCGGHYRPATGEDLTCDRCGDDDGKRLLDRTGEYDRLCEVCIQELGLRNDRDEDTDTNRGGDDG